MKVLLTGARGLLGHAMQRACPENWELVALGHSDLDILEPAAIQMAITAHQPTAVVNCAAGKDRTGILCALTHHVLGVDRETIFIDYELTNQAANVAERLPEMARLFNEHIGKSYADDIYHPFVGVDAAFLEAAIASIEDQVGSLDAYLQDTLGVDDQARSNLMDRYLV